MADLTINGYELDLDQRQGLKENVIIGGMSRGYSGKLRGTQRARKGEWALRLFPFKVAEAIAHEGLLLGEGHYWSFDSDLYSSKGLGPRSGYSATLATGGKYGGKVSITSITYAAGLADDWAVLVYRWNGSAWDYYAVRSDGAKWLNSTRNDAASTTWLAVDADGDLTLTGAPTDYDELVALPYLATADMIVAWQALTTQFSSLPKLNVSGDVVGGKTVECMCDAVQPRVVGSTLWQIDFVLREV